MAKQNVPTYAVRKQLMDATLAEGLKAVTAGRIGRAILANCAAYRAREIRYEQWDAEQRRLWDLATTERMRAAVCRVIGQ